MTLDRMKLSAQTVRDNISILEEVKEPDDAGYELQLEHEKFVLECVEKQIPKKPVKTKSEIVCPTCRTLVGSNPYCKYCGQALDWSETE